MEFQEETIGKYGLHFNGKDFVLVPKQTACLAQDQCDIRASKQKLQLAEVAADKQSCCTPGSGCC